MGAVKGSGSIIPCDKPEKTCRNWILQVHLGRNKLTGKYEKKQRRFHGSKTQAKQALRGFIAEIEAGQITFDQTVIFKEFATKWLHEREKTVRKGTSRKDKCNVKNLIKHMGGARMCDIDAAMIVHVMDLLATVGGMAGKPLSGSTCQGAFITLGLILSAAVRAGVIPENPCKYVDKTQRPKNDTKEKDSLTLDEARELQEILMEGDPDPRRIGLLLALNCGLSREEFTGLSWSDIDFGAKCLRVKYANTADDDELMDTKNDYRQRIIPLDDAVADRLYEWKLLQAEKLAKKGIRTNKHTAIVSNPVGEFIHPEAFGKWWRRYRKKIGLDEYGLHQLRHTFATILCASGADIITASKLMGHCDTTMLSRIYAHMIPEYARQATNNVASVLSGNAEVNTVPFLLN